MLQANAIAGIFIGGQARRMGGIPKGLLIGSDRSTLIGRWVSLFHAAGIPVVLVGASDAYRSLNLPMLSDDPANVGPLGGLISLLRHAEGRCAIAVACDMPWASAALLERLISTHLTAPVLAPQHAGRWEPFFARYDAPYTLPIALNCIAEQRFALHHLLNDAGATPLPMTAEEISELRDWDTVDDLTRDGLTLQR